MIFSVVKISRSLLYLSGGFVLIFIFVSLDSLNAGQNWSLYSSASLNSGSYIYEQTSRTLYLTSGVRWRSDRWNFTASMPLIWQENPTDEQDDSTLPQTDDGMHAPGSYSMGLGDIYLYSSYRILTAQSTLPSIAITAQVKIPTGSELTFFSTGAADYGLGLTLNKQAGPFNIFADAGYLKLGDPVSFDYSNPLNYGIGVGRWFQSGQFSASLYMKNYTEIIPGLDPPGQVSLGLFKHLANNATFSLFFGKGYSESSPDFTVTGSFDWKL